MNAVPYVIGGLVVALSAFACARIYRAKDRAGGEGAVLGLLLGPLGVLWAIFTKPLSGPESLFTTSRHPSFGGDVAAKWTGWVALLAVPVEIAVVFVAAAAGTRHVPGGWFAGQIESAFRSRYGAHVSVSCPGSVPLQARYEFLCYVHGLAGLTAEQVTILNGSGQFVYQPVGS